MRGSSNRRVNWQERISPGSAEAYTFAAICVVIASLLRWGLGFVSPDILTFPTYYPAVLFAALVGGAGPGLFAAVLGGIVSWWAFMSPQFAFMPLTTGQQMSLLMYLFAALLIVWGADHYRRLAKLLADEEALRKLSVQELSHRLKNKLATIQAIIRLRTREHPQLGNDIIASLDALSATDELIMATQGHGAPILGILSAELRPYEQSQATMDGPDVLLPPNLAMVLALLVHELATNAAKYGALSSSAGKVSIRWSLADGRVALEWRESDGPIVSTPVRSGFGTRLFSRALAQFGGAFEADFATTGVICKFGFEIPENSPSIVPKLPAKPPGVFASD
jgi:two-component sensor histidine kinase